MRRTRAQALVELALVVPFLILLLCATIEFGWTYYQLYHLNNAARIGARVGCSQGAANYNAVNNAVGRSLGPVTLSAPMAVAVSTPGLANVGPNDRTAGNYLTVYVRSTYAPLTGLVDLTRIAGIRQLRASCTMVIQALP